MAKWNDDYLNSLLEDAKNAPPKLREWWDANGEAFCEALGFWPFEREWALALLIQMKDYSVGGWKGYKDSVDRTRCEVLVKAAHGEEVDRDALRLSLALMFQAYNAACEHIRNLEQRQRPQPPRPRLPIVPPRRPR